VLALPGRGSGVRLARWPPPEQPHPGLALEARAEAGREAQHGLLGA